MARTGAKKAEKENAQTENAGAVNVQSIEDAFHTLEELSQKLEDRETSLEDSFQYYKQGMELLKYCSEKLDNVEKKMLQINEDGTVSEFSRELNEEN